MRHAVSGLTRQWWNSVGARLRHVRVLKDLTFWKERKNDQCENTEKQPCDSPTTSITAFTACQVVARNCEENPDKEKLHVQAPFVPKVTLAEASRALQVP